MEFKNDFSITRLFITKKINITVDNNYSFIIQTKTLRDFYNDNS